MYRISDRKLAPTGILASLAFVAMGCGGGVERDTKWPQTYPVTGVLVMDGKPVVDATVGFVPPDGKFGARGRTDAEGKFTLSTLFSASFDDEGAIAGKHRVTVYKPPEENADANKTETKRPTTPEEAAAMASQQMSQRYSRKTYGQNRDKSGLNKDYMSPDTTPLNAEVKPGEENEFIFELTN